MYDALNTEIGTVAGKTFKVDLTEASEDKLYAFETNGGGYNNIYYIIIMDSISSFIPSYLHLTNRPSDQAR